MIQNYLKGHFFIMISGATYAGAPENSNPVGLLQNGYYPGGLPPVQQAHSTTAHDGVPPHSVSVSQSVVPGSVVGTNLSKLCFLVLHELFNKHWICLLFEFECIE